MGCGKASFDSALSKIKIIKIQKDMKPKKKFKDTTLAKVLLGAVSIISPEISKVLEGVMSPQEAIKVISESSISVEDKIKIQTLIFEQQNKEMEAITSHWQADLMSDSWLSKNVRPLVLVWCIVIFTLAGILDSIDSVEFTISEQWNDTFEKVMMSVILIYFGGRSFEKVKAIREKLGI